MCLFCQFSIFAYLHSFTTKIGRKVTIFKKTLSPYTVPLYAVFQGLALGGISAIYNNMYTGIVQQAIFLTFGIFAALLFAYKTKIIEPTFHLEFLFILVSSNQFTKSDFQCFLNFSNYL